MFTPAAVVPFIQDSPKVEEEVLLTAGPVDTLIDKDKSVVSILVNQTHPVSKNQVTYLVDDLSLRSQILYTETLCTVDNSNLRSDYHKEVGRENYRSKINGRILLNTGRNMLMEDLTIVCLSIPSICYEDSSHGTQIPYMAESISLNSDWYKRNFCHKETCAENYELMGEFS